MVGGYSQTIDAVADPAIDCKGIIPKYLKDIENGEKRIFPRENSCLKLNEAFLKEKKNSNDHYKEKVLFIKYGKECALRNAYQQAKDIEKKNSAPKRYVYSDSKRRYYISIDTEHGGLEVFDGKKKTKESFDHLGEYDFSCKKQKSADKATHRLYG